MAIVQKLPFSKRQLRSFALLFRQARIDARMTQLQVAQAAFEYKVSHCKVSRVERAAMPKVDAHCLERMATVLKVPDEKLLQIDPKFASRAEVARTATEKGFWGVRARVV